jgi:hypothetical protein
MGKEKSWNVYLKHNHLQSIENKKAALTKDSFQILSGNLLNPLKSGFRQT